MVRQVVLEVSLTSALTEARRKVGNDIKAREAASQRQAVLSLQGQFSTYLVLALQPLQITQKLQGLCNDHDSSEELNALRLVKHLPDEPNDKASISGIIQAVRAQSQQAHDAAWTSYTTQR